jgi:hypothetical protein
MRSLKSQTTTTKAPAKVGSIYTSALIHKMPPGVPRYLAQKHADAKREVFEAALAWGLPFVKGSGIEFSLEADEKLQNTMDQAVKALVSVEAEIAAHAEKRGKK